MIESEIWKPVVGYEDLYLISNKGNLKSLSRTIHYRNGKTEFREGRIRKPNIIYGYRNFLMTDGKGGKRKNMRASRMVAMAFIPNPENKPCVDHIDTNTQNDCVENLHWVTYSENNLNPITRQRMSDNRKGFKLSEEVKRKIGNFWRGKKLSPERIAQLKEKAKPVLMFSKSGELIKEYRSASIAQEDLGICMTHISACCIGKRKSTGGYMWRYKDKWDGKPLEPFKMEKPLFRRKPQFSQKWYDKMKTNKDKYKKIVYVYDLNMNFICQCSSVTEAALKFNTFSASVSRVCNGKLKYSKGYIFSYERR